MSFTGWSDPFDIFFSAGSGFEPMTNVGQNSKEIILQLALPGFSRSDIDVEVNNGRISVRASAQKQQDDYEYSIRDIHFRDYSRAWSLPKHANADAIEAQYEAGILTVKIPFTQSTRETIRKIELR
jgi:HSP20 family protein